MLPVFILTSYQTASVHMQSRGLIIVMNKTEIKMNKSYTDACLQFCWMIAEFGFVPVVNDSVSSVLQETLLFIWLLWWVIKVSRPLLIHLNAWLGVSQHDTTDQWHKTSFMNLHRSQWETLLKTWKNKSMFCMENFFIWHFVTIFHIHY